MPFFGDEITAWKSPEPYRPTFIQVLACDTCKARPGIIINKMSGLPNVSMCAECWREGKLYPAGTHDNPSTVKPGAIKDKISEMMSRVDLTKAPMLMRIDRSRSIFYDSLQTHMLVQDRNKPEHFINVSTSRPIVHVRTERDFVRLVRESVKFLLDHEADEQIRFDNERPYDPHLLYTQPIYKFPDERMALAPPKLEEMTARDIVLTPAGSKITVTVVVDKKKKPPVREAKGRSYVESKLHGKRQGRYGRETVRNPVRKARG